jgi:hypothetical protein
MFKGTGGLGGFAIGSIALGPMALTWIETLLLASSLNLLDLLERNISDVHWVDFLAS